MTNQSFLNKLKNKIAIILAIVCVFCMSIFCLTACDEDETKSPEYSYTDPADGDIANANFTVGTASKDFDAYPIVSATSWTRSYHMSSISSYVDSGVIDVSSEGWTKLKAKLSADKDLIDNLVIQFKDDIIEDIRTEKNNPSYAPSSEEISNYVKDNFDNYYKNPGAHTTAKDGKVYMINNYAQNTKYYGDAGTAQTVTSASTITLEKGKVAKISLYVKTMNICGGDANMQEKYGANIRLVNTINGKTQAEYRLSSIIANDWTLYTIYVQADKDYSSTINLAFGLGYGLGSNTSMELYTQGTAFFDDVKYEVLDKIETVDTTSKYYVDFGGKTPQQLTLGQEDYYEAYATDTNTNYLYDMSLSFKSGYFNNVTSTYFSGYASNDDYFNYSNISGQNGAISSKDIYPSGSITPDFSDANKFSVTLNKASASVKLANQTEFVLDSDQYAILTFRIDNKLTLMGSNEVTINLFDVNGTEIEKRAVNFSTKRTEKDVLVTIFIHNNFEEVDNRQFFLVFNIGPADIATAQYSSDLASGTVSIYDIAIAKGIISDTDADTYKYYEFLNSSATDSLILYAGNFSDFNDTKNEVTSHTLTTKPSDFGTIRNYPANVKEYEGVVSDHHYITENGTATKVDTRSGLGDGSGSHAGLINTKYLTNYQTNLGLDVASVIGEYDDDIQPLMIYNKTADSYGYLSDKFNVTAGQNARITAKVRVVGDAVAYLYLVDVAKREKEILTFGEFTPNVSSDEIGGNTIGEINQNNQLEKLMLKIDASTLANEGEEWVEVNFYVGVGATDMKLRLEVWNGSRDGLNKSQGYVFFDDIEIITDGGFSESEDWGNALFADSTNPLFGFDVNDNPNYQLIAYRQKLTDTEKQFNKEYADDSSVKKVEYKINYIWAKTDSMVYAVYNTINPEIVDPYESIPDEEEGSGCTATTDPSTFWLNFSSILLGVALLFALIMLIVKISVRKYKANKNDAKSHYTVTSRIKKKSKKDKSEEQVAEEFLNEINEEIQSDEQNLEEVEQENAENEDNGYVYGEVVEDFEDNSQNTSNDTTEDSQSQE